MKQNLDLQSAVELLLAHLAPLPTEALPLSKAGGRILATDFVATCNIPPFPRSPFDGYAFLAADTTGASKERPVTLRILEEVQAGHMPEQAVQSGLAVKILTGAPIPLGADAVTKYEATEFTEQEVKIFEAFRSGDNICPVGEDVKMGSCIAKKGTPICPALAGSLGAQGVASPTVYQRPRIGILSTGDELVNAEEDIFGGKIRNSNRYTLEAACRAAGGDPVFLGAAKDCDEDIAALFAKGFASCDLVISTGGVSVGDYDKTKAALALAGAETLLQQIDVKPGSSCAFGVREGKLACCLSGNPAAAMTIFYLAVLPCIKKLAGYKDYALPKVQVTLLEPYGKSSPKTRALRGQLDLTEGVMGMRITGEQGNGVLTSLIGCDLIALVPEGRGKLDKGTVLEGYLLK